MSNSKRNNQPRKGKAKESRRMGHVDGNLLEASLVGGSVAELV
jgi:hypothetical protein